MLGRKTLARQLDDGLDLYRVTCPVGVLLVIFEARPEVLIQIVALAIKSGNVVILKGGKEAQHSLKSLHQAIIGALKLNGMDIHCAQLILTREEVGPLLEMDRYIDLVIPRGSNTLVRQIQENTRIPGASSC
jgi:glutamate-5-semialdehyde dehydrogenase